MRQRARLELDRALIIGYRRRIQALDERLPAGSEALRRAAWAGLQDSMPRAALLSIHARVAGTGPSTWEDPSLVQLWGPRFSAYMVAARDRGVFTLGRLSDELAKRRREESIAARLAAFLDGRSMDYSEAGHALGVPPNSLRYAAPTGTVLIRWDGARRPTISVVPPPELEVEKARVELARRYLHVFGPSTADGFAAWAGVRPAQAQRTFEALGGALIKARTPVGAAWILDSDEPAFRGPDPLPAVGLVSSEGGPDPLPAVGLVSSEGGREARPAAARLLPSGDTYFLLQGAERALLVPDAGQRATLWTPRVWPGAVLLGGETVGTWRRTEATVAVQPWRRLSPLEQEAVVAEAESLPLPGLARRITVRWEG